MLASKLIAIREMLKNEAIKAGGISQKQIQLIDERINEVITYARDMAEEEQRLVAETPATASGKQEKNQERYPSLVKDLNRFFNKYSREVIEKEAA